MNLHTQSYGHFCFKVVKDVVKLCIDNIGIKNKEIFHLVAVACSELTTIRNLFAVVTILYVVLLIVSFVASIIGCAGACCARRVCYIFQFFI